MNRTDARKRIVAGLILLLPIGGSLFYSFAPAKARSVENVKARPALVFQQYLIDRHMVDSDESKVRVYYRFKNVGKSPLTIKGIQPSCGCLQVRILKMEFQPKETGEFQLELDTAKSIPGDKQYDITVTYNDPEPREVKLMFRATVPEKKVSVRPRALIFYQFNAEPTKQELVVEDFRNSNLQVLGASTDSDLATIEPLKLPAGSPAELKAKYEITVQGNIPSGRHRAAVTIVTDDPEYPELHVPLLIQGPPTQADQAAPEHHHDATSPETQSESKK